MLNVTTSLLQAPLVGLMICIKTCPRVPRVHKRIGAACTRNSCVETLVISIQLKHYEMLDADT